MLAAVITVYVLSLFGVHFRQRSEGPLPPLDLSQGSGDATIVQLRLEELKPVANRLSIEVLAYPGVAQYDNRFDVLAHDVAVRLYPTSDLGDLQYPKGKAPAQLGTTIEAHGDPGDWPFDSYRTEPIAADAFRRDRREPQEGARPCGSDRRAGRLGHPRQPRARSERAAHLPRDRQRQRGDHSEAGQGSADLRPRHLPGADQPAHAGAAGCHSDCAGQKEVFAAVGHLVRREPVRDRPAAQPRSWIDQAIVRWVLIALITAMSLYIVAWVRQGD
jgi:Domain of unknown function (DUF4436)